MMYLGVQRFSTSPETCWLPQTRTYWHLPQADQRGKRRLRARSGHASSALANWVKLAASPCGQMHMASRQFSKRVRRRARGAVQSVCNRCLRNLSRATPDTCFACVDRRRPGAILAIAWRRLPVDQHGTLRAALARPSRTKAVAAKRKAAAVEAQSWDTLLGHRLNLGLPVAANVETVYLAKKADDDRRLRAKFGAVMQADP